jgi:hypothetical protein
VEHWADGGGTSLDNLVLLCRRHHRAVHEGGFELRQHDDGTLTFFRPDGRVLEPCPTPPAFVPWPATEPVLDDIPVWDGTPFNLVYAMDVLYRPA